MSCSQYIFLIKKNVAFLACCNHSSVGCATYVMIKNIVAFIFAAVLIDFDRKFINGQATGLFSGYLITNCRITGGSTSNSDLWSIMLSLAKGQLADAIIILISSLVFVGIYIYVYIRAFTDSKRAFSNFSPNQTRVESPQYPRNMGHQSEWPGQAPASMNMHSNLAPYFGNSGMVLCQKCGAVVDRSGQL